MKMDTSLWLVIQYENMDRINKIAWGGNVSLLRKKSSGEAISKPHDKVVQ